MESTEVSHRSHVNYEFTVPSTGRGGFHLYTPTCRCGWSGKATARHLAIREAEKHAIRARAGKP